MFKWVVKNYSGNKLCFLIIMQDESGPIVIIPESTYMFDED